MDWPRAKSMLIIVFLILDIFLAFQLWGYERSYGDQWSVLTREELTAAKEELEELGLTLEAPIPDRIPSMGFLTVRPEGWSGETVERYFKGVGGDLSVRNQKDQVVFVKGPISVTLQKPGTLIFENLEIEPGGLNAADSSGVASAREAVAAFVADSGMTETTVRLEFEEIIGGSLYQKYTQLVGANIPLFGGALELIAGRDGVSWGRRVLFDVIEEEEDREYSIIPATEALRRAATEAGDSRTVTGIETGYYTKAYEAQKWEAAPVWVIHFADGRSLFVNGFTGQIEGSEDHRG